MKKTISCVFLFVMLLNCEITSAAEDPQKESKQPVDELETSLVSPQEDVTEEKGDQDWSDLLTFQLGTRSSYSTLTDSDSGNRGGTYGSGTFLGTIYKLDEDRDLIPNKVFGRVFFRDWIGLELAYDSMKADTKALSYDGTADKSDGKIIASGPTLSIVAQYLNKTDFTPYVQLGVGFYFTDFDETAHWQLGYSNPQEYAEAGSPTTPKGGRTREMVVDDAVSVLLGAGCTYRVKDHWLFDVSAIYTKYDVDGTFYGNLHGKVLITETTETGSFPMDNYQLRVGVAYEF